MFLTLAPVKTAKFALILLELGLKLSGVYPASVGKESAKKINPNKII